MALKGLLAFSRGALEFGGNLNTTSWTIELVPHNSFAQLTLADCWDGGDEKSIYVGITRLTHRKDSGEDKVISFLSPSANVSIFDLTKLASDPKMSSITVGMGVMNAAATWMIQIFNFD